MRNGVQTELSQREVKSDLGECAPAGCCPPDRVLGAPRMNVESEARLGELSRALGHPARVRILRVLLDKNVCIAGELAEELPLAASTVSQHLKILKEVGFIKGEVDGPRRCYCADRAVVREFAELTRLLSGAEIAP